MTDKQKKTLFRILVTFALFAVLLVCEHTGMLERIPYGWLEFLIYLAPYLIIGYDILYKAYRNIRNGQVFDENFLMVVATIGAFGVREIAPVDRGYDGYLPGICQYRRRRKAGAGGPG